MSRLKREAHSSLQEFSLAPHTSLQVVVALRSPAKSATRVYVNGDILSATLVIADKNGETSSVPLTAQINNSALRLDVLDGQALAAQFFTTGSLTETQIMAIDSNKYRRRGYIADGNSRLLLRAQSNKIQAITFTVNAGYMQSLNGKEQSKSLTIRSKKVANNLYQATAIMLAPDVFPTTTTNNAIIKLEVRINANISQEQTLNVRRVPILLVHGLWGSDSSWRESNWLGKVSGLKPWLEAINYRVGTVEYPNWQGPSQTMLPDSHLLANAINLLCQAEQQEQIACTRADVVAHSMGGLVVREFIRSNSYYRQDNNFQQGSIHRFISLGTPYKGSGFASFLLAANDDISQCITNFNEISNWHIFLNGQGQRMGSAMDDLQPQSQFLNRLLNTPLTIPTYAIVGDMKQTFMYGDVGSFIIGIPGIAAAGCSHANLFHNVHADQIVSVDSAQGDIDTAHTIILPHTPHVGMGKNKRIFKLLTTLLQQPYKSDTTKTAQDMLAKLELTTKTKAISINASDISANIVLSSEHGIYAPNDSITLRVTFKYIGKPDDIADINDIRDVGIYGADGLVSKVFYHKPYEWTFTIPAQATGSHKFHALATISNKRSQSATITIVVKPNMLQLSQLLFDPAEPLYITSGKQKKLHIFGLFTDGYKRPLDAAMGNKFSELLVDGMHTKAGDSPVIAISQRGVVTAMQPGIAEVMVSNGRNNTVRRIIVAAVELGDADGDGLSDADELRIGTQPYNSDSDGDGLQDALEVGNNINAPFNSDGIGVIDALDAQVLGFVDKRNTHITLKTTTGSISAPRSLAIDDFPPRPKNMQNLNMQHGILDFHIENLQPHQKVDVSITLDNMPEHISKFIKYGAKLPDGHVKEWYEFSNVTIKDNTIILHLQDNALGDSDPILGVIHDPIGMAVQ